MNNERRRTETTRHAFQGVRVSIRRLKDGWGVYRGRERVANEPTREKADALAKIIRANLKKQGLR